MCATALYNQYGKGARLGELFERATAVSNNFEILL